jgi:hypothetical protein
MHGDRGLLPDTLRTLAAEQNGFCEAAVFEL